MKTVLTILAAALGPALFGSAAHAEERLDHRGAAGLSLGVGVEHASVVGIQDRTHADENRLTLDLSPTLGLGTEGNEIVFLLRLLKGPDWGGAIAGGYRGYFGREELKTFFELSLKVDTVPHIAAGPMGAFGVMYDFSPLVGLFGRFELSGELGKGLRGAGGLQVGIQGRSYLLE